MPFIQSSTTWNAKCNNRDIKYEPHRVKQKGKGIKCRTVYNPCNSLQLQPPNREYGMWMTAHVGSFSFLYAYKRVRNVQNHVMLWNPSDIHCYHWISIIWHCQTRDRPTTSLHSWACIWYALESAAYTHSMSKRRWNKMLDMHENMQKIPHMATYYVVSYEIVIIPYEIVRTWHVSLYSNPTSG